MDVKTFGVVGAGQMGGGIAQVAATSGLDVIMQDIEPQFLARGVAGIDKFLTRSVDKGRMDEEGQANLPGGPEREQDLSGWFALCDAPAGPV